MSDYHSISLREFPGRIDLYLQRPPLNVLNIEMMNEINRALEASIPRTDLKALVIRSDQKAFSAGVDVGEHTAEKVGEMMEAFGRMFRFLNEIKCITVAVVRGAALGGGCELATYCDIILASDRSKFGQPEITVGVYAPVALAVFPQLVGRHRALELLITGEIISGEESYRVGLVNRVFPDDQFNQKVEEFLAKIVDKSAAVISLTKRVVDQGLYLGVPAAVKIAENAYLKELMSTQDAHEGLRAFLEKRPPSWQNK
jgi:cyclohexa-1,5-dienecarbonyl-CoA hydratase